MLVPQLLLESLEWLTSDDFQTFKWYLSMKILEDCRPIPKSRLETASQRETVTKMMDSYGEESAVNIAVEVLKKMNINDVAKKLMNAYAEGKTAAPTTCSSVTPAPSPGPTTISAQNGSMVFAPKIIGSNIGSFTITTNNP
ncbi:pyrin-like [Toxotes jaculatrix]|uniref:pyrin-like n=1 Tax=Toxotes jaculatrix TaxID=941984 RepID=UPI001B3AD889|nr:pyrin-like [Toxotes jaculatrix]XP_040891265.1 pyrin-like [Toxotes jaculatrix]XP_040891266.1 pyrin-like [Toxotes jaculatrix]